MAPSSQSYNPTIGKTGRPEVAAFAGRTGMRRGVDTIVGINWGSSNFRAHLIGLEDGLRDSFETPAGVAALRREDMAATAASVLERWPGAKRVYAAGMIGSNIGWADAGYADCPADGRRLAAALVRVRIGGLDLDIVPGLACVRERDAAPDIMRGEETELVGLLAGGRPGRSSVVALPGTHTKWVRVRDGRIAEFMTAMSGEIYDRLAATGLLSSVVDGHGADGPEFRVGVRAAAARTLGLGTLLFGVRARVIRGALERGAAAGYLRGLLIGAEIADALDLYPEARTAPVPLVGSAPVCALYRAALEELVIQGQPVPSTDAVVRGFLEIDALRGAAEPAA
jgi:2-dehydro-3-deoxygalactonokinase